MDFLLISQEENTQFQFPVNPPEITLETEKQIETVNILNLGEVDFSTGEKRFGIRFSSFFPRDYDPSYCGYADFLSPVEAVALLSRWRDAGKPLRLIITGGIINDLVLLTGISFTTKGGEPGDIYFDVSFRTWREIKVRTTDEDTQKQRPDTREIPNPYIIKTGDTLYQIAKLYLGDGNKWKTIYENNKAPLGELGPDPDLIYPGQRVVLK
jgi:nucleoid-associated protein YgaU